MNHPNRCRRLCEWKWKKKNVFIQFIISHIFSFFATSKNLNIEPYIALFFCYFNISPIHHTIACEFLLYYSLVHVVFCFISIIRLTLVYFFMYNIDWVYTDSKNKKKIVAVESYKLCSTSCSSKIMSVEVTVIFCSVQIFI